MFFLQTGLAIAAERLLLFAWDVTCHALQYSPSVAPNGCVPRFILCMGFFDFVSGSARGVGALMPAHVCSSAQSSVNDSQEDCLFGVLPLCIWTAFGSLAFGLSKANPCQCCFGLEQCPVFVCG